MLKIYFICGFVGSGKTTYAKQLAISTPAFRFSIDEWMIPLYGEHMERAEFDARLANLQGLFKDAAVQMLELDVSVVFDFGFWKKSDRLQVVKWAQEVGFDHEFHYVNTSFNVCCCRAFHRNLQGNNSYEMTQEMLDLFWSWFEVPDEDDLNIRVVTI